MKMNSHSPTPAAIAHNSASLADIFSFLSMLMRYPDTDFFDSVFLDTLEALLSTLDLHTYQQSITTWRASVNDPLLDAQLEYTRLFINGTPHVIAPPYGSIYLDGDRNYHGKTTERTRDFYRKYGFDLVETSEPADHIRFELEFLSCLFREEQFEAAEIFMDTLFLPWFEKFQHKFSEGARHPLYQVSLQLILFFTKEEQ